MLKQQMFNVTTIKHFLLVAWPCLQRFSFKKTHYRIAHIKLYNQSKRLVLTAVNCSFSLK